jgi:hypothetical protein
MPKNSFKCLIKTDKFAISVKPAQTPYNPQSGLEFRIQGFKTTNIFSRHNIVKYVFSKVISPSKNDVRIQKRTRLKICVTSLI